MAIRENSATFWTIVRSPFWPTLSISSIILLLVASTELPGGLLFETRGFKVSTTVAIVGLMIVTFISTAMTVSESLLKGRLRRQYSGRTLMAINLSSEANEILENLAKRSGGDKADVLRKSIGLMELAMQAHEQGKAVGATGHPDALDTEFTGFQSVSQARRTDKIFVRQASACQFIGDGRLKPALRVCHPSANRSNPSVILTAVVSAALGRLSAKTPK